MPDVTKPKKSTELSEATKKHYLGMVEGDHGIKVQSSQIEKVGHDGNETHGWLIIKFHSGASWAYHPVTLAGYHQLIQAESCGKWFNENIKKNVHITGFKLAD